MSWIGCSNNVTELNYGQKFKAEIGEKNKNKLISLRDEFQSSTYSS